MQVRAAALRACASGVRPDFGRAAPSGRLTPAPRAPRAGTKLASAGQVACRRCQARAPRSRVLRPLVSRGWPVLRAERAASGVPSPGFVERAFADLLTCGVPEAGFIHLMERASPEVPIQPYVLSPPSELVGTLAAREDVLAAMARVFVQSVFRRSGASEPSGVSGGGLRRVRSGFEVNTSVCWRRRRDAGRRLRRWVVWRCKAGGSGRGGSSPRRKCRTGRRGRGSCPGCTTWTGTPALGARDGCVRSGRCCRRRPRSGYAGVSS
jgi:hypothetical protein